MAFRRISISKLILKRTEKNSDNPTRKNNKPLHPQHLVFSAQRSVTINSTCISCTRSCIDELS